MIYSTTNLPKFVEDFAAKYDSYTSGTKFNRDLSRQQLERKETAVIYSRERKDRWKNGEIVLAPFGNLPRKLNPGDSLEHVVIRRRKRRRNAACFFTLVLFLPCFVYS